MSRLWTVDEAVDTLEPGMTVGFGGWGSRRKPMAFVRAIAARPHLTDLTVVSYGGPDVGILCALGRIRKLVFGFVSLDSIPLEPHFRAARQAGTLPEVMELDEGLVLQGLRAAAWRVPFLPTRVGLHSAVTTTNDLRTVRSPYDDGEELLAMPALPLDVAFVHVHRATPSGTGQVLGDDPYMDAWYCRAATRAFVSCEQVGLQADRLHQCIVDGTCVDGVVHAPGGAWFTDCSPDYPRDEALQRAYAATAKDPTAWAAFVQEHLS